MKHRSRLSKWAAVLSLVSTFAFIGEISVSLLRDADRSLQAQIGPGWDMGHNFSRLMMVAQAGDVASVKAEIRDGASVNLRNNLDGGSALEMAASEGHDDVVRVLLANGANVNIRDDHGVSPLIAAATDARLDVVSTLLDAGADARLMDQGGLIALQHAQFGVSLYSGGRAFLNEFSRYQTIVALLQDPASPRTRAGNALPAPP